MNATASAPGRGTGFFFSSSASNHWFVGILLLCVRFYAGYTIARVGLDSLPTWGESGFADRVVETGLFGEYATIVAFLAKLAEFAGGIFLAIGLFTRWSAFFLAVTLGFAAYVFNGAQPFLEKDPAAMYSWLFLMFFAVGPGVLSLDALARHAATPKEDGRKGGGALWLMIFLIFAAAVGYPLTLEYLNTEDTKIESHEDAAPEEDGAGSVTEDSEDSEDSTGDDVESEGDGAGGATESEASPEAGLQGTSSPEASGEAAEAAEASEAESETSDSASDTDFAPEDESQEEATAEDGDPLPEDVDPLPEDVDPLPEGEDEETASEESGEDTEEVEPETEEEE